jgi:hypothetical protein
MVRINVTLNVTLSDCSPSTRDYVRTDGRQSRPKGGIRTFGARVWFFLHSFGGADLLSESGVRGGLDARPGASRSAQISPPETIVTTPAKGALASQHALQSS